MNILSLLPVSQTKLCECDGYHHSADPSSFQSAAVWSGRSFSHREHLQCHQNWYVPFCYLNRKHVWMSMNSDGNVSLCWV